MLYYTKIKEFIINSKEQIQIISKLSVNGIISASILSKALQRLNKIFTINFFKEINQYKIKEISLNQNKTFIVLDPEVLDADLLIRIEDKDFFIISNKEQTTSELTYNLIKEIDNLNSDLVYLPIITNQQNTLLVQEAEKSNQIKSIKAVKLFGSNTRPIHKTIELSIEPFIMGFSGSEENTINLLKELGIPLKIKDYWNSMQDLTDQQIENIISSLSLNYSKQEIIGTSLILNDREKNNPLKDLTEFKLFLELCVLYNQPSLGIAKCLLSKEYKERASTLVNDYKHSIINALSLFYTRNNQVLITEKENCILINYGHLISELILGKVVELIQNSELYPQKKRVIALCNTISETTKAAIAFLDKKTDQNIKNFISSLPIEISEEITEKSYLYVFTTQNNENKLIELVLEAFEGVRIEEISK